MSCDCPRLVVRKIRDKGRGLFSLDPIVKGAIIEVAPVLLFEIAKTRSKMLDRYTFEWDDDTAALALGKCSLLNHSYSPNVLYKMNRSKQVIIFKARWDIQPWRSELVINYNFDPEDRSPVGFKVR